MTSESTNKVFYPKRKKFFPCNGVVFGRKILPGKEAEGIEGHKYQSEEVKNQLNSKNYGYVGEDARNNCGDDRVCSTYEQCFGVEDIKSLLGLGKTKEMSV